MAVLEKSRVVICGLGGVGSWAAEALARSGVGALRLVDLDEICVSNVNRQVHALETTVGLPKATVLAARCRLINPHLKVEAILDFVDKDNAKRLLVDDFDVVVDAVDSVQDKAAIMETCLKTNRALVTIGGAGGRVDPTLVRIQENSDLLWLGDRLLKSLRKLLKTDHAISARAAAAVYSLEKPQKLPENSLRTTGCDQGYGTAAFVTAAFGMAAAKATIDILLRNHISTAQPLLEETKQPLIFDDDNDDAEEEEGPFIELDCPCSDFDS